MTVPSMVELKDEAHRLLSAVPAGLLSSKMRIGIYGAGFLGTWAVNWLRQNGIEPVACFDTNPSKIGSRLLEVQIHGPSDLGAFALDFVLITARHAVHAVSAILKEQGVLGVSLDAYYVATQFFAFEKVHDLILNDARSQETLRAVMASMLRGRTTSLETVFEPSQYFCLPRFRGSERDIYIDAGAYVGDTVERFLWASAGSFERIYAFEPGRRQFEALTTRCARLSTEWAVDSDNIVLEPMGLSDQASSASTISSNTDLQSLALSLGSGDVNTVALDDYLMGRSVTFIKADVEGMEMQLLHGAQATIKCHTPKLAICVYHLPSDIPQITDFVRQLVPDYRFALRHHSPRLMETVLYCWKD
ncbi:FkbM family methyltransferase [Microvirga rosea]|uniref:FkbM family methyltransferase n=1 Tax=Microvirga rosea TaxID=2715425 RepID=UPI001D0A7414|nr:FkbM family methyltransferase [Microvirga rosea]MCB8823453.1 FkbM family methyltransferase [Microvirga rosea]